MNHCFARLIAGSVLAAAVSAAWSAAPQAATPAGTPSATPSATPDNGVIRFDIGRFEVVGNSILTAAEIDAVVTPFTGKGRDFGTVQQALEALEGLYHARGYKVVTVQLPEQELNGGVVRLNVIQTRIGRINVRGNRYVDESNVRRSLPTLVAGQTPNLTRVSASLRMANENLARKISLKLQNGEADDEVDANLEVVDEKPWKAMLNLDNSGNRQTGTTHAGVVLQHANLWGRDHVASVQYTTTLEEPSKVSVYGAGYHIPLYEAGDSIDLFGSYSNVNSGSVIAGLFDLTVSGKGTVYGARYNLALARRGEVEPRLVFGVDVKAFKNSMLLAGENLGSDITVRPLSLGYVASATLPSGDANLSLTLVRNIPGGSRGKAADFARVPRSGAKPGYTLVRFAGAYSRAVMQDWQVRVLLNGQVSADALVPGEQFGAGGGSSVRGLDERAVSTDSGAAANLELYTPNLCGARWQCRALAFYDAAYGKRNKALAGELTSTTVGSTGLGLRLSLGSSMNMQVDYGHVVRAGNTGAVDKNRAHVRVSLAY